MSLNSVLVIPDTHTPHHDKRAWSIIEKIGRHRRPHSVIHMGDWWDCYLLSRFSKDPTRQLTLKDEIQAVRAQRAEVDSWKPKVKKFIEGNHEDRLRRYLQDKAPELFELTSTDELLELTKNGWEFTPYMDDTKLGKVYFTHDTGGGGKYSTARSLETYQHSVVVSHHHAIQMFVTGDATGQYQVGAQFGWLGDIDQVDYMHRIKVKRTWALGCGWGYHDTKTGLVYLQAVPIVDYTACIEGKVYRA